MVLASKETNDFTLDAWDAQHFLAGLSAVAFMTPELKEQKDFVATQTSGYLQALKDKYAGTRTEAVVEPTFPASYAEVVLASLKYNLQAQLTPFSHEIPAGKKELVAKSMRSINRLAKLAKQ